MDPPTMFQDATDVDQSLPISGASTPGPAIGDTGREDQPNGELSQSPRMAPIFTRISLSLPPAESINDIGREIGRTETLRSTRGYVDNVGSHLSCTVTKETREGTSLAGAEGDTEKKFGPLKVVLEGIPALYADHEVRLKLSAQASPLTNTLAEDHRCEQQDRKPPRARSFFGRMF